MAADLPMNISLMSGYSVLAASYIGAVAETTESSCLSSISELRRYCQYIPADARLRAHPPFSIIT
ncbi:hypothetical protein BDW66DRAFT_137921 [Aspergillus desertorum]